MPPSGEREERLPRRTERLAADETARERFRQNPSDAEPRSVPFRPTDVPSPVFGFRARPQRPAPPSRSEEPAPAEGKTLPAAERAASRGGEGAFLSAGEATRTVEEASATANGASERVEGACSGEAVMSSQEETFSSVEEEAAPAAEPAAMPAADGDSTAEAAQAVPVAYTVRYALPSALKAQLAAQNVPFNVLARPVPGSIAIVRVSVPTVSADTPRSTTATPRAADGLQDDGREEGAQTGSETAATPAADRLADPPDPYVPPPLDLLDDPLPYAGEDETFIAEQKRRLEETLRHFHVRAHVIGATCGPTVTRFEVQPEPGVKVSRITALADDIKLNLAARDIRIEAPIPGRSAVGIEVPNRTREPVFLKRIVAHEAFQRHPSPLAVAVGVDIGGEAVVADLRKMPHLLIAGATGSGKSVCINALLVSLLYKASPDAVRLLLVDPKMVELTPYQDIPHLVAPVVTDPKLATAALHWAVQEMERRYELFARCGARDLDRYNRLVEAGGEEGAEALPYIVIVIDELADLMMVAPGDVEEAICRIAQKARACGIHLVLATQRPSVDVITGLIKANIPTRIAFAVSSQADSRTILDMAGAEKLLGRGDMLYLDSGDPKPRRLQGCFVSDEEIERVVAHVRRQRKAAYWFDRDDLLRSAEDGGDVDDELLAEAVRFVIEQGQASASMLQRRFRIGYNRAARLIDAMEARGWISAQAGSKPRTVHITEQEYRALFEEEGHTP
ncbi:DNA translocase FtsK [Calditerricola satsumensis]